MSYCRWSSDNWRCDLYCYEDASGGFTTHVARNRVVGAIPELPDWQGDKFDDFMRAHKEQMAFLSVAEREPIGGPHDGETFNDPNLGAFRDRLLALRFAGYHFPDDVLEQIDAELHADAAG